MKELEFNPPLSTHGFLRSTNFGSLIVGPGGSTKTTAGIMKIARHAAQMAQCHDGVRRSRAVWIRNTVQQLNDTSIPDFLKWYPDGEAGMMQKTDKKFTIRFLHDDNTLVECEVLFRGLDDANDVRRLLSLQASFAIMDEFREIHKDIFQPVMLKQVAFVDVRDPCFRVNAVRVYTGIRRNKRIFNRRGVRAVW